MAKSNGLMGIWDQEKDILKVAETFKNQGFKKFDAVTPYPVHGMEEACGIERSWIPYVTFVAGTLGLLFGLWFTWWVSAVDWPINVGGKPMWSLPAFVPVIFELTILFAALISVGTLFAACSLPKHDPVVVDPDLTSHKFGLFIDEKDPKFDAIQVESLMHDHGVEKIHKVEGY